LGKSQEKTDSDDLFDTSNIRSDLKGRAVRGGLVTIAGQFVIKVIQLGSTAVLARLLTPQDYGLFAMIMVVTGFMWIFQDLGLSMATIHRERITHEQINALFWINLGLSLFVMIIVIALAPVLMWFYGEPELLWLVVALSVGFVFSGLAMQLMALLKRQMRFGTLAGLNITALGLSVAAGIGTAWMGAGVWALVYMELTKGLFIMLIVWVLCPWRPSLPIRFQGVGSMLAFGGNLTGFNVVNYFARGLDKVLIGRYWGPGQLGLYSRAYQLMMLPIIQVSAPMATVAIPTLSRLQSDPERFRRYYLKAISFIAFITMPGVIFMVVMSEEIIRLVLGEQWIGASRIFAVLGISALIQPIYNTQGWLHVSIGRTDRAFRWGLVGSAAIIASFFVGVPFGALAVASCYTAVMYLIVGPCLWYAGKPIGLKLGLIFSAIWRFLLSSICAGMICRYIMDVIGISHYLARIGVGLLLLLVTYVTLITVLYRELSPLKQFVSLLHYIRGGISSEKQQQTVW